MSKELERQVAALQAELRTVCVQYDEALLEIDRLNGEHERVVYSESMLRQAHAVALRSVRELEDREERYRNAAETWARDSQTLTDEIETASLVQRFMVRQDPIDTVDGLELVSSYRPASQTSGDWFGFDRDNAALTILVGDATGHGLPASLLTAGVFAAVETLRVVARMAMASVDVHSHLETLRLPELLLSVLHDVLTSMGGGRYGMTFLAARYDPRDRSLQIANAAHPPPLWIRRDATTSAQTQTLRSAAGTPLGLMSTTGAWGVQRITMAPGDQVLFYTDGLTEAVDVKDRTLGTRRVAEWLIEARDLPIEAARDQLQTRFDDYVAGRVVHDDVTFVLVRARAQLRDAVTK